MAKHPRYVVNGSKESSVHVCQLLNEALQCVCACGEVGWGGTKKTSGDHATEVKCQVKYTTQTFWR